MPLSGKTNYAENKLLDLVERGQAFSLDGGKTISASAVFNKYYALGVVDQKRANSLVVALNDTVAVNTSDGWRLYKVTTAGTLAASQPSYPGADNEVITDGTAVLTDQYDAVEAGAAFVEPSGADYARSAVAANMTNFSGTQGTGTTVTSSGTDGTNENNVAIAFPDAVTEAYAPGTFVFLFGWFDESAAGNLMKYGVLNGGPIQIGLGATGIEFAANQLTMQEDT